MPWGVVHLNNLLVPSWLAGFKDAGSKLHTPTVLALKAPPPPFLFSLNMCSAACHIPSMSLDEADGFKCVDALRKTTHVKCQMSHVAEASIRS